MSNRRSSWRAHWPWLVIALGAALLAVVVRPWSGPLFGDADTMQWEYGGYSFAMSLRWGLVPRLELFSNDTFYPYGVSRVFQPWSLERDGLLALMDGLFGFGPWLRWYYLASVTGTAAGAYLLLRRPFGQARALWAGCAVSLLNFYAIAKFPGHLSLAALHWTVLGCVLDFRLLMSARHGRLPDVRLILLRGLMLVLSLGQELGYVANFGLVSFTIFSAFSLGLLLRHHRGWPRRLARAGRQWRRHRGVCVALIVAMAAVTWFYVPLILQIKHASGDFPRAIDQPIIEHNRTEMLGWVSPMRLLVPHFPGFNPRDLPVNLGDEPVEFAGGTVGWTLLLPAVYGLWCWRRRWTLLVPPLLVLALLMSYQMQVPLLRLFPWAAFARVCERGTMVYPMLLALLGLGVAWQRLPRPVVAAYLLLVAVEVGTLYHVAHRHHADWQATDAFHTLMATVQQAPGEAVLDWPFCVAGGNGVGTDDCGLFFGRNSHIWALSKWHRKKVMGQYMGRLMPSQPLPYVRAGWNTLFMPDLVRDFRAQRQRQRFSDSQWSFFEAFFRGNDFCGILIYTDLLAAGDREAFHERFGAPTAAADLPRVGLVEFIPRRPDWPRPTDPEAGKRIVLAEPGYHHHLGLLLMSRGWFEEAIPSLRTAIEMAPQRAAYHNDLGITLAQLKRTDEATAAFERALAVDPSYRKAAENLARLRELTATQP